MIKIDKNKENWREQVVEDFQRIGLQICHNKKYSLKDVFGWGVYFKYGNRNFKIDEDFKKFPQPLLRRNIITGDQLDVVIFHEDRFLQYIATLDDKKTKHNVDRNIVHFDSELFEIRLYAALKNIHYSFHSNFVGNTLSTAKHFVTKFELYNLRMQLQFDGGKYTFEDLAKMDFFKEDWKLFIQNEQKTSTYDLNKNFVKTDSLENLIEYLSTESFKKYYDQNIEELVSKAENINKVLEEIEQIKKDLQWRESEYNKLNRDMLNMRMSIFKKFT